MPKRKIRILSSTSPSPHKRSNVTVKRKARALSSSAPSSASSERSPSPLPVALSSRNRRTDKKVPDNNEINVDDDENKIGIRKTNSKRVKVRNLSSSSSSSSLSSTRSASPSPVRNKRNNRKKKLQKNGSNSKKKQSNNDNSQSQSQDDEGNGHTPSSQTKKPKSKTTMTNVVSSSNEKSKIRGKKKLFASPPQTSTTKNIMDYFGKLPKKKDDDSEMSEINKTLSVDGDNLQIEVLNVVYDDEDKVAKDDVEVIEQAKVDDVSEEEEISSNNLENGEAKVTVNGEVDNGVLVSPQDEEDEVENEDDDDVVKFVEEILASGPKSEKTPNKDKAAKKHKAQKSRKNNSNSKRDKVSRGGGKSSSSSSTSKGTQQQQQQQSSAAALEPGSGTGGRRRSSRIAEKSYRSIKSYFISTKQDKSEDEDDDDVQSISSSTSSTTESPSKKPTKSKKKKTQDSEKSQQPQQQKQLDEKTREFLYSGLPSNILKVQKQVEKKQELDAWLETAQFYPKISHVIPTTASECDLDSFSIWPKDLQLKLEEEQEEVVTALLHADESKFKLVKFDPDDEVKKIQVLTCCQSPYKQSAKLSKLISKIGCNINLRDTWPWIEKYKPSSISHLAVDPTALETFNNWLKSWKNDITDNDGVARRHHHSVGRKRKRHGSDSDFVTSDDDYSDYDDDGYEVDGGEFKGGGDLRKKSVVLVGPTGCGKTGMVYVVAETLGFKVVEINFSSSRSGREVLEQVEEATVSHRIQLTDSQTRNKNADKSNNDDDEVKGSSSAEDSNDSNDGDDDDDDDQRKGSQQHCLLLFEDINLDFAEDDDDGFYRALVSLITTSVRPIVMTISNSKPYPNPYGLESTTTATNLGSNYFEPILDPKIERTNPLMIQCKPPSLSSIVDKVLAPIVEEELQDLDEDFKLEKSSSNNNSSNDDYNYLHGLLCMLTAHSGCDIRSSVNTLQFYWDKGWIGNYNKLHTALVGSKLVPLGFNQFQESSSCNNQQQNLDEISITLSYLTDFDMISTRETSLEEFHELYSIPNGAPKLSTNAQVNFIEQVNSGLNNGDAGDDDGFYYYNSILYEPKSRQSSTTIATKELLTSELSSYLDYENDYESAHYICTITKLCILNSSIGTGIKRHGRIKNYFNRLSPELIKCICTSFDFEMIKSNNCISMYYDEQDDDQVQDEIEEKKNQKIQTDENSPC